MNLFWDAVNFMRASRAFSLFGINVTEILLIHILCWLVKFSFLEKALRNYGFSRNKGVSKTSILTSI